MSDTPRPRQPVPGASGGSGPAPTIDLSGKRKPNAPRPMPRPVAPLPAPNAAPSAREGLGERPPLTEAPTPAREPRRPETPRDRTPRRPETGSDRMPRRPEASAERTPRRPEAGIEGAPREQGTPRPRTAEPTAGDRGVRRATPAVGREWTAHMRPDGPPATRSRLAALLGTRSDVRRALIVSEVLGPPVSLRRDRE